MKNTNRIGWIDITRGICIFCVVLSHTETCPSFYRWFFSPYFMPAFFFLSGVVYKPSKDLRTSFVNSFVKLLWPYTIGVLVSTFVRLNWIEAMLDSNWDEVYTFFSEQLRRLITGRGLWFLPCLFIVQIISSTIIHFIRSKYIHILISVCSFIFIYILNGQDIVFWSANTALFALGYFMLGYIIRDRLFRINLHGWSRVIGPVVLFSYFTLIYLLNNFRSEAFVFDMHCNTFSATPLWFLVLSLMGIFSIFLFALSIGKCRFLQFVGSSSLIIYMYHGYSGVFARNLLSLCKITNVSMSEYVYSLVFAIVSVLIACGFALFINKHFPILIGKGVFVDRFKSLMKS